MPAVQTATNAAIWYAADGYDPGRGLNGRRVAGESFLRGFFAHARVDELVCLAHGASDHAAFAGLARAAGVTLPLRAVRLDAPKAMAPVEVVSYPAPLSPVECWRRALYGPAAWALTGITHTTATAQVMQAVFDLRSAPQMPWDALICTSSAVQASIRHLMELAEDHLAARFPGAVLPARPLLPILPLGVHCADHAPDPAARSAVRQRLGIGPADVAAVTIARLTPDEKFDPLPLFLALELAAADLPAGARLHLILCGQFREGHWEEVFARAAAQLMPSCGYHLLDGASAEDRRATLSGGDLFVFPIDNVQETFGLAPIEAMAAGLPLVVSDWDGMKDSVTPETGFRIATEMPRAGVTDYLSLRHFGGTDGYLQYLSQLSAMTRIDVAAMARAIAALAADPALRAQMGQAGRARAERLYDWRVVIPQMQELWGEQAAMLAHARQTGGAAVAPLPAARLPVFPPSDQMFAAYPTRRTAPDRRLAATNTTGRPGVADTFGLRDYARRRRLIDDPARIEAVLAAYRSAGPAGASEAEIAAALRIPSASLARITLWLLKYHFLQEAP